jgi:hypothetical protein
MELKWLFLTVLAVENLSHILTTVDLLEPIRCWLQARLGKLGKLATCGYCQSFWLSIAAAYFLINDPLPFAVKWIVVALAAHRAANFISEFMERYMNRAPLNIFATVRKEEPAEPESKPKKSWFS